MQANIDFIILAIAVICYLGVIFDLYRKERDYGKMIVETYSTEDIEAANKEKNEKKKKITDMRSRLLQEGKSLEEANQIIAKQMRVIQTDV